MALPAGMSLDVFHTGKMEESSKRKRPPSAWGERELPARKSSSRDAALCESAVDALGIELAAGRDFGLVRVDRHVSGGHKAAAAAAAAVGGAAALNEAVLKKATAILRESCPLEDMPAIASSSVREGRDYRRCRTLVQLPARLAAVDFAPPTAAVSHADSGGDGVGAGVEVLGALTFQVHALEGSDYALELVAFGVARRWRRQGRGRRLVQTLCAIARRLGLRALFVSVAPQRERRVFWEACGFSPIAAKVRRERFRPLMLLALTFRPRSFAHVAFPPLFVCKCMASGVVCGAGHDRGRFCIHHRGHHVTPGSPRADRCC